jgi:hypothetical protein
VSNILKLHGTGKYLAFTMCLVVSEREAERSRKGSTMGFSDYRERAGLLSCQIGLAGSTHSPSSRSCGICIQPIKEGIYVQQIVHFYTRCGRRGCLKYEVSLAGQLFLFTICIASSNPLKAFRRSPCALHLG